MTDVERRYSQTEREALVVVWGCERFHIYLYGKGITLYTDDKPLEVIYIPESKPPPQIEQWALRPQPYRFKVIHMPGKTNPADLLSRLPLQGQPNREQRLAKEYINYLASNSIPKAISQGEIVQRLEGCLHSGKWPAMPELCPFYPIRSELSVVNGLVLGR